VDLIGGAAFTWECRVGRTTRGGGGVASWENRHPRARVGSAIEAEVGLRPLGLLEMLQLES